MASQDNPLDALDDKTREFVRAYLLDIRRGVLRDRQTMAQQSARIKELEDAVNFARNSLQQVYLPIHRVSTHIRRSTVRTRERAISITCMPACVESMHVMHNITAPHTIHTYAQ